jgi:DNA polymerase-3 subunit delta
MSGNSPTIYLLHGNDEFAINSFLEEGLKPKMGSTTNAAMDITALDGRNQRLEAVQAETHAMPFLSERRMVILHHPLALTKGKSNQQNFITFLESVPTSTALVLVEGEITSPKRDQPHWLLKWSQEYPDLCWTRNFTLPTGPAMVRWIQNQAKEMEGEFENKAAQLLSSYINEDPRLAKKEIEKLLTYVDFSRPVREADVEALTADVRQGDVFEMVDAIGYGDGEKAMFMLRRLLEGSEPLPLFGMVVRQFRLLIQVRELLDEDPRLDHTSIANTLGVHPYPIQKIMPQAKLFQLSKLKAIFHQLTEVDQAIKTNRLNDELALDLLIASLTH